MIRKLDEMYQMNTKCIKWSINIPNIRKIFQMAIHYINLFQTISSQGTQNFTQVGIIWFENKPSGNPDCKPNLISSLGSTGRHEATRSLTLQSVHAAWSRRGIVCTSGEWSLRVGDRMPRGYWVAVFFKEEIKQKFFC
jgi:hypothetical protein